MGSLFFSSSDGIWIWLPSRIRRGVEFGDLRQRLGRQNQISIHLREPADTARLAAVFSGRRGVDLERIDELSARIRCDREAVSSADLIRRIVDEVPIRDIYIEAEPIEEIVKNIYGGKLQAAKP